MGHYDGQNYTSSIMSFLDAGKEAPNLEEENKKLKQEVKDLKNALIFLLKTMEDKKDIEGDYILKYGIETAKSLIRS